jgi:hypothetical protein
VPSLQRTVGNAAVVQLLRAGTAVQRQFGDTGKASGPASGEVVTEDPESGTAQPEAANEFGEIDGAITSHVVAHAMSDKGATAKDLWHHAGGTSGWTGAPHTCGEVDLTAPVYESSGKGTAWKAWIKGGTGGAKVTRSFTGGSAGDNGVYKHGGGQVWISSRGAKRLDKHENAHTKKSKEIHDTHIKPLEKRISKYRGIGRSSKAGTSKDAAIGALKTEIDWNATVKAFADEDIAQNAPMAAGGVDVVDMATADFYKDFGAHDVKGTTYDHYVDIDPGP